MNAATSGVGQQDTSGTTNAVSDSQGAAKRAQDGMRGIHRHMAASKRCAHAMLVARRHHGSDHCDTECTTDLEGHGIGR